MSTPSNKRDARREARKANLANAQSARRMDAATPPTDTDATANVAENQETELAPEVIELPNVAPEIIDPVPAATPEPPPAPEMVAPTEDLVEEEIVPPPVVAAPTENIAPTPPAPVTPKSMTTAKPASKS